MTIGRIVQSLSGYYDVSYDGQIYRCRARGNFRARDIVPLVGDYVEFSDGYLLDVKPRHNQLRRPAVANVDQGIVVCATTEPDLQLLLLDRMLIRLEVDDIEPVICFTKIDLLTEDAYQHILQYAADYQRMGYRVLLTSTNHQESIHTLAEVLKNRISVLAGQSGAGKSSLLNSLDERLQLQTDPISHQLNRGKHTTRRIHLLDVAGGLIADTPGFSSVDFQGMTPEKLALYFPDIRAYIGACKFRSCLHLKEPKCAVKDAVSSGIIATYRYQHYEKFFDEIKSGRRRDLS